MRPKPKTQPPGLVAHILDVVSELAPVECRRFFGGWGLRSGGVQFAMVIRDELYLSVDAAMREALIAAGCEPFSYVKAGKRVVTAKLYAAPSGCLDDPDELRLWAARAIRVARGE